jgi:hypothetical protein
MNRKMVSYPISLVSAPIPLPEEPAEPSRLRA